MNCPYCGNHRTVVHWSGDTVPCPVCAQGVGAPDDSDLTEHRLRVEVERLEAKLRAVASHIEEWRRAGYAFAALSAVERVVTDSGRKAAEETNE